MIDDLLDEAPARRIDLGVWKGLWPYARPYRRKFLAVILCALCTAGADVGYAQVTRSLVDAIAERGRAARLGPYVALYAGLVLVQCASVWRFIRLCGSIRTHLGHDIRRAGFDQLQRLSFSFFDRRPVGWLMARMTSDCERLSQILAWGTLDVSWALAMGLGITAALLWMEPTLALLVLAVVPPLALVSLVFQRRILSSARAVRRAGSRLTAAYNEELSGMRTTRVLRREERAAADFEELADRMQEASVRNALQSALYLPLVLVIGSLAVGLALASGGQRVLAGSLGLGTLIAFLVYARQLFEPIQDIARRFAELQMAQASAERILALLAEVPEVRDRPELLARAPLELPAGPIQRIELCGLSFAYRTSSGAPGPAVLEELDLEVRAGETIALVGSTGGGKTTLVSLVCRFYEPTAGAILVDGVDLRERPLAWLRARLSIVQQVPHLFSGSVLENIRYGRLEASDEEVFEAARLSGAHELALALEHGYATEVGEGGARLSSGERQLVSLARALLADREILILDEATSSVDARTEQRIQRALAAVLAGRTSFVIAHRLSTIRSADRILVLEQGRIVEQGSHAELFARRGRYHALYAEQSLRESAARAQDWEAPAHRRPAG